MIRYAACILLALSASALHSETLSPAWVELGDGGKPIERIVVRDAKVIASGSQSQFGYALLTKSGANWKLALKSRTGKVLFAYSFHFQK